MIDLGNRLADGGLVQELLLVDQTGHQGDGAHLVDAPRQAFVSRIELDGGVWPNWAAANVKEKALPWRRPAVCHKAGAFAVAWHHYRGRILTDEVEIS